MQALATEFTPREVRVLKGFVAFYDGCMWVMLALFAIGVAWFTTRGILWCFSELGRAWRGEKRC